MIHIDRSSTKRRGGVGIVITSPEEDILKYGVQLKFPVTNNEVEYEAILTGLRMAWALGSKNILLRSDSQLIIGQVKGDFEAKKTRMQKYLKFTNQLVSNFNRAKFVQIPRNQNAEADKMAQSALADDQANVTDWRLEEQNSPNIEEFQTLPMHARAGWASPILSYLKDGRLPLDLEDARKIQRRAARFTMLNGELYKRGFSQPYLRCVEQEEAKYVLEEVHRVICGDHMGVKSLVRKNIRTSYFWPSLQQDTIDFIKRYDSCQRHGNVQRVLGEKMRIISSPWPFAQWGVDIMGPLPQGKRQVRFLLITIDYFMKWVKAEALITITEAKVQNFVWKNIVCRFGIPRTIILDNGRQINSHGFKSFCSSLGIKNKYSSPGHP